MRHFVVRAFAIIAFLTSAIAYAQADPSREFAAATKRATEMDRYAFTLQMKLDQDGRESVSPIEAKVDRACALEIKIGPLTYYQKDSALAQLVGGEWKKFDKGARTVEAPTVKPEKGVRVAGMLGFFASLKAPHEMLTDFSSKMKAVTKAAKMENDCVVFSGELTEEAIKYLAMHSPGHHGGGKMEVAEAYRGHAKFWVNDDGAIAKFEFYTEGTTRNPVKDRIMKVKNTRTYQIKDVGDDLFHRE